MKTAITITLIILAALTTLGAVAHEDPRRGRTAAAVAVGAIAALAVIVIMGGA